MQVLYHLTPPSEPFIAKLEELVFKNWFLKLDEVQQAKKSILLDCIRKLEDVPLSIENDEDFEFPPEFEYITKNLLTEETCVIEPKSIGCECVVCSKDSDCCPNFMKQVCSWMKSPFLN